MKAKTKHYLYKTPVRLILEYPAIQICVSREANMTKIQCPKQSYKISARINPMEDHITNEELHQQHKVEPMNVRMHNLAEKIWHRLPNFTEEARELSQQDTPDHYWWPMVTKYLYENRNGPPPKYV